MTRQRRRCCARSGRGRTRYRGERYHTVVTRRDGRLAFAYVDYASSPYEMRCLAIERDKHSIILGATVSVLDARGALTSVDGEASAWASGQFAHLLMRRSVYKRTPAVFLWLTRTLPTGRRDDFLTEVLDEIESARQEGLPVRRRYASIVLRTLPIELWQRVHGAKQPETDSP